MFLTTMMKTEEDKYLSLALAGRDPLGTQIVWQQRARPVVPALTAASRWPEGFQLLLTVLAWWPSFAQMHRRPATDQTRFFLLFEQAAARACRATNVPWRLPGTRRLSAGDDQKLWVGLDPAKHLLLDRPLANGVWGIYRGPLINAGVLKEQNMLDAALAQEIRKQTDEPPLHRLFDCLNQALNARRDEVTVIAKQSNHAIVQYLMKLVQRIPSGRTIHRLFVAPTQLCRALAQLAVDAPEVPTPKLLAALCQSLPDAAFREELAQIEACEHYLACLDALFGALCHEAGKTLPRAAEQLTLDMQGLRVARDRFARSGRFTGPAQQRHRELCDAPLGTVAALAEWLLAHHAGISRGRGTAVWLEIGEDGRLLCRVTAEPVEPEAMQPATAWRNGYYLDALAWLARHLARKPEHG